MRNVLLDGTSSRFNEDEAAMDLSDEINAHHLVDVISDTTVSLCRGRHHSEFRHFTDKRWTHAA